MSYTEHFERELKILQSQFEKDKEYADEDEDEYEDKLCIHNYIDVIREILKIASDEGHSGFSASFYASVLSNTIKNALTFNPLSPLTGEDSEWNNLDNALGGKEMYQNNRLSAVFKDGKNGQAYYIDAIRFQGEDEYDCFSGSIKDFRTNKVLNSRQYIKSFPFTPKNFSIDVARELYDKSIHGNDVEVTSCGDGDYVYCIKNESQLDEVYEYYDEFT